MELARLPNLGPVLAQNLHAVGIHTPEALARAGAEEAWLKLRLQVGSSACLHWLLALAGAAEGAPKKDLPPEQKAELSTFFNSHK